LLIDLANRFKGGVKVEGVSLPKIAAMGGGARIAISWDDYRVPDLTREEWVVMVEELREVKKGGKLGEEVLVCCVGGHGRTGTCLSILAYLMGATTEDPVKFVREVYCKKAVESNEQLNYIEEVCQCEVKEEVSKVRGTVQVYGGGYGVGGAVVVGSGYGDWKGYTGGVVVDPPQKTDGYGRPVSQYLGGYHEGD